jgi:hypothetical protein
MAVGAGADGARSAWASTRVVDAVADHCHLLALRLERADRALSAGRTSRDVVGRMPPTCDRFRQALVAGQQQV